MKISGFTVSALTGGLTAAALAAPIASADEGVCSAGGVASTVSSVTGAAQQYLAGHPGAGRVLYAAANQSPTQTESDVRGYFTAHPQEYYDLRGILAPIGETQRTCNVTVLPPEWASAYDTFMAG